MVQVHEQEKPVHITEQLVVNRDNIVEIPKIEQQLVHTIE